jgi:peptidoglycan hydrolase-like protein with peptidoglycan-binding domain
MIKVRNVAVLLALSSVAALAACSGYNNSPPPSRISYASPQPAGLSPDMIAQVQTRLQQNGNYNGRIDGVWGPVTERAVSSYQQQHNMNATGQLDNATLTSLNVGGGQQNYGNSQPAVQTLGSNDIAPTNPSAPTGVVTPPAVNPTR